MQRYIDDPGEARVVVATTMRTVFNDDRSSWELVPVAVYQIWLPTEAGRYRKKPDVSLCADDIPGVLRSMARLFEHGLTPASDNAGYAAKEDHGQEA